MSAYSSVSDASAEPTPLGADFQRSAGSADDRPIDLVYLSRQTLGDRQLEIELLGLFERQAAQIAAKLATEADRQTRLDLAHMLKGSARAVGARAVGWAAERYEATAAMGCLADLQAAVADARAAVHSLVPVQ